MTPLQRVQAVWAGRTPDRVPVCLHNFMMAAREAAIPLEVYRRNPAAIASTHLLAVEKYGYDCIVLDTDTTMLAEAMALPQPGRPTNPDVSLRRRFTAFARSIA